MIKKMNYITIVLILTFFNSGASNAVNPIDSNTDALITKTIEETLKPYERDMDISINGIKFFSDGFIQEFRRCPHDMFSESDIQEYLPNFILRVVAQKLYINETLGKYCAVQFLRSTTQRRLCGPSLLSESQSSPIKNELMKLWVKTESILNEFNFNDHKKKIHDEIRVIIGRSKQSLCDPTYVSAPVNFNSTTAKKIIDDFHCIVSDIMNLEITNREISEKYETLIGPLGGLNPALDQQPSEFRVSVRMNHIPVIFALLFDQNLTSRKESIQKFQSMKENFQIFKERKDTIDREIEINEMTQFGQSKISSEKNGMQKALDNFFLKY